jgi:NADH dehydrogenase/NADH:ubiquinone oxidoreductase subunit G
MPDANAEATRIDVVINGQRRRASLGSSILDALRAVAVQVPTLCHDDRLEPTGA